MMKKILLTLAALAFFTPTFAQIQTLLTPQGSEIEMLEWQIQQGEQALRIKQGYNACMATKACSMMIPQEALYAPTQSQLDASKKRLAEFKASKK